MFSRIFFNSWKISVLSTLSPGGDTDPDIGPRAGGGVLFFLPDFLNFKLVLIPNCRVGVQKFPIFWFIIRYWWQKCLFSLVSCEFFIYMRTFNEFNTNLPSYKKMFLCDVFLRLCYSACSCCCLHMSAYAYAYVSICICICMPYLYSFHLIKSYYLATCTPPPPTHTRTHARMHASTHAHWRRKELVL